MKAARVLEPLRRSWKWLLLLAVVGVGIARVKWAPVPVEAVPVWLDTIVAEVMGTGTLEARVKTTLSPRIQERLAEVLVDQGDTVKAGQLLARLDAGELERQLAVAEATLNAVKASLARTRADEERALAVQEQARLTHDRALALRATQIAAQADVDKAIELRQVADAEVNRARAAIAEAELQVITAERNLAYHRERLGFTQLTSPYDGLVVRRDRDPGGVVVPGSSVLQLISTNELWISAWVDETSMAGLAPDQPARVVFRSLPETPFPGRVARLGREADRETREFLVDVRVEQLPANWAVGQRAEVFIETGRRTAVPVIPQRYVVWRGRDPGVFVDARGRAAWRPVRLGLHGRDLVEVTEGLAENDRVVAPLGVRARSLQAGQRIRVPADTTRAPAGGR
ncbi:MAG: efflux RND transporter periplasmic adaptor subunit [Verrucomicrobia bacterium]|nr:efflux RND transporter periplasmic adaptor subunit [Verrucomicrobiota bacterium]